MKLKKVLVALGFALGSLTLIAPTPSKAQGGCPDSFVPIGGGYCRNITCPYSSDNFDDSTKPYMIKYNLKCGTSLKVGGWGNQTIPMR